nr:hypothetical protein [Tanacetum cinerariifolium]
MNQNYFEPNPCYDSNYSGFDRPQTYSCALCGNDHHYGSDCLPRFSLQDINLKLDSDGSLTELLKDMKYMFKEYRQREQAAKLSTHTPEPSGRLNSICYDDDDDYDYKDSTIPLNEINSQIPSSIVITTSPLILPIEDPKISLIMGNEELNTILENESNEFTKSKEKVVTFSNPLFSSNDDFTSSDDESLSDKDVSEDNVKIYSNPLFEFDDEYISSVVNPLFNEVLENIKSKDSYDSNLDEPDLLVTPLFDSNEDEYFTPVDDIELLLHHDPSIPMMSVDSILEGFTDEPSLEENADLFDLESKNDEWKKILYDAPIDDLMSEDKIFDPGICVKKNSPTYVSLPFEDRQILFFTYVVRILLLYFTYPVVSPFLISSGQIPSGEIKVHIEVLSMLWGNRLPIPDGLLPLARLLKDHRT